MSKSLDTYQRAAEVYPVLLVLAPAIFLGIVMLWENFSFARLLVATIAGCGGSFLFAQIARDRGKKQEQTLFQRWGGMPSVAIFRYRDPRLSAITKTKCHQTLTRLVTDTDAPTPEQEKTDPESADAVYSAWSDFLRTGTRNRDDFYLLHKENINYGYRRNVWGLRCIGSVFSLAIFVACAALVLHAYNSTSQIDWELLSVGTFSFAMFAMWMFYFRADWVKVPADAYAARLAESANAISARHEKTE